jgi:hypothetical protein
VHYLPHRAQTNPRLSIFFKGRIVTCRAAEVAAVNWEQRLRDMILAGAALTAAACSDSVQSGTNASDAMLSDGAGDARVPFFCCNANGDPCCPFVYCGQPMTPACACKSDGGTWNYSSGACSFSQDTGPGDAVAADATDGANDATDDKDAMDANNSPGDAPADAVSHYDVFNFCCNANPDPCCPFVNCGQPMTPACACKSDGGMWNYSSGACSFPSEAGPGDAGPEGGAHD